MNSSAHNPEASASKSARCILVVEDTFILRYSLSGWLRHAGYNVVEAASADEAIILLSSPVGIDLVITDVEMPGRLDGYGLVEYISRAFTKLPVIIVSGNAPRRQADKRSVFRFFRKPYDLDELLTFITKLLRTKQVILDRKV